MINTMDLVPDTTYFSMDHIVKFAQKLDDPNTFCYGIWLPGAEDIDLNSFGSADVRFNCYQEGNEYIVWGISIFADPRVMTFMEVFLSRYRELGPYKDDSLLSLYNSITMDIIFERGDKQKVMRLSADFHNYTVSEGTLDTGDLIENIMGFLTSNHANAYDDALSRVDSMEDQHVLWEEDDEFLNEFLIPLVDSIAPLGYYFGSHPGDGSCLGFWEYEEKEYDTSE